MNDPVIAAEASRTGAAVAKAWETALQVPATAGCGLVEAFAAHPERDSRVQLGLLLLEIGASTGVNLPLTVVFQSPTAADLAEMAGSGDSPRYERPIRMRSGAGQPLLVFPGIGGIGLEVLSLVRHLRFAGPLYFNPPQGVDGAEPHHTLDDVVADHLDRIRSVQPHGPYWLLGYSWGGLVALEIARSLRASGETIAFVGLIDPVLSQVDWTFGAWLQYIGARFGLHWRGLRQSGSPLAAVRYAGKRVVPLVDKVARLFGVTRLWPLAEAGDALPGPLTAIWSAESAIIKQYRLRKYDGPVTVFATRRGHAGEVDPRKVWPSKVARLDLHWVPGDHDLKEPGVAETAAAISDVLARVNA
nr:alpha/beta fold hydrolase [uncultured Rhodopila sp.]